jgi:hypothetical protein
MRVILKWIFRRLNMIDGVDCIHVGEDRRHWAFMSAVRNLWVPYTDCNFLTA